MRHALIISLLPVFLLSVFLAPLLVPGCNAEQIEEATRTIEEISAGMADIQAAVAEATAQKAAIDAALADMPAGETRDKAIALSAKLDEAMMVGGMWLARADASIAVVQAELANAEEPLDVVEGVIKASGPLIPAPWGAIVAGVGGLVIGLARAAWNRYLARKIVRSVEPTIKRTSEATRVKIGAAQGDAAGALVDEAQAKKPVLPF